MKMDGDVSNSPVKYRFAKAKRLQNAALEALVDNAFNLAQNARESGDFGFGYKTLLELERLSAQPELVKLAVNIYCFKMAAIKYQARQQTFALNENKTNF